MGRGGLTQHLYQCSLGEDRWGYEDEILKDKFWRVTSSSEVVEEPADGGTTEGSMGEQRELQER